MSIATDLYDILDNNIQSMSNNTHFFVKRPHIDLTRKRKFGLELIMKLLIGMKGNTIHNEIKDFFKVDNYISNSAFVQQRAKLNDLAFPYLFETFNNASAKYDTRLYKGYRLLAVDGSDFNIALNKKSESYINGEGNILHLNAICDVLNNVFIDILIEPKSKCDERKSCVQMITNRSFDKKSILIADRGYPSYQFFALVSRIPNLDYLVRVQNKGSKLTRPLPMCEFDRDITIELRTTQTKRDLEDFRTGKAIWIPGPSKFGKDKKKVSWTLPSPYQLTLRVLRFKISETEYETIVTSLNRFEFSLSEIKKLYHKRWQIETSFRWLKYALSTIHFHGKSEEFSVQEVYARIIMYNFSMKIMMNTEIKQDSRRKHFYQINFTIGFNTCREYWCCRERPPNDIIPILQGNILPVRPNRKDKRNVKHKSFISFIYRVA